MRKRKPTAGQSDFRIVARLSKPRERRNLRPAGNPSANVLLRYSLASLQSLALDRSSPIGQPLAIPNQLQRERERFPHSRSAFQAEGAKELATRGQPFGQCTIALLSRVSPISCVGSIFLDQPSRWPFPINYIVARLSKPRERRNLRPAGNPSANVLLRSSLASLQSLALDRSSPISQAAGHSQSITTRENGDAQEKTYSRSVGRCYLTCLHIPSLARFGKPSDSLASLQSLALDRSSPIDQAAGHSQSVTTRERNTRCAMKKKNWVTKLLATHFFCCQLERACASLCRRPAYDCC